MSYSDEPQPGSASPPHPVGGGLDDVPTTAQAFRSAPDNTPVQPVALAVHYPLLDSDPDKVGDFWLDSRLSASPAGTTYAAHEDSSDAVMLVLLSDGAAGDPAARARFSGEINAMHIDTVVARGGEGQDEGRMGVRFRHNDSEPDIGAAALAPWAALAFDGSAKAVEESVRVLHAVDLSRTPPLSQPSGPDYRLHWIDKIAPGATRSWPLPWPGRKDRAGWITMLVAFLLMALITAVALLLAILLFQNQPLVNAPQPIPSSASSGSGSGSGEPTSGAPNESESSASPVNNSSNPPVRPSDSPTMNDPSGSASGPADPSVNPKL